MVWCLRLDKVSILLVDMGARPSAQRIYQSMRGTISTLGRTIDTARSTIFVGDADQPKSCGVKCKTCLTTFFSEILAEFLGTATLMIFGMGSVAQFVLSSGTTGSADQVRWAWGLGVTFGVLVACRSSEAHLNPAVTLAMVCYRRLSFCKLFAYWIGQYLGAFSASFIVHMVYSDALASFKEGNKTIETASIFSTYPQPNLSWATGLGDQICGTAILMMIIFAIGEQTDQELSPGLKPLLIGLSVVAIGMALGHNCGYAINPARDLGPRIYTYIAGWGLHVFSFNDYNWFWIPLAGPHIGALVGGAMYALCINGRWPWTVDETVDDDSSTTGTVTTPRLLRDYYTKLDHGFDDECELQGNHKWRVIAKTNDAVHTLVNLGTKKEDAENKPQGRNVKARVDVVAPSAVPSLDTENQFQGRHVKAKLDVVVPSVNPSLASVKRSVRGDKNK